MGGVVQGQVFEAGMSVAAKLEVGSDIVVRSPGLILSGKVIEVGAGNLVRARMESPWGVPFPDTEWFLVTDVC